MAVVSQFVKFAQEVRIAVRSPEESLVEVVHPINPNADFLVALGVCEIPGCDSVVYLDPHDARAIALTLLAAASAAESKQPHEYSRRELSKEESAALDATMRSIVLEKKPKPAKIGRLISEIVPNDGDVWISGAGSRFARAEGFANIRTLIVDINGDEISTVGDGLTYIVSHSNLRVALEAMRQLIDAGFNSNRVLPVAGLSMRIRSGA